MSATRPPAGRADPLALIEAHVVAVESATFDADQPVPPPVDLAGLELRPEQLDRARDLLARLEQAGERVRGMQHRLRGELAGMPRTGRESALRAPRFLDVSA